MVITGATGAMPEKLTHFLPRPVDEVVRQIGAVSFPFFFPHSQGNDFSNSATRCFQISG